MRYESESEMYPDVCRWLKDFLASRFQSADVDVLRPFTNTNFSLFEKL